MQFCDDSKTCNFLVWHMTSGHDTHCSADRKWLPETRGQPRRIQREKEAAREPDYGLGKCKNCKRGNLAHPAHFLLSLCHLRRRKHARYLYGRLSSALQVRNQEYQQQQHIPRRDLVNSRDQEHPGPHPGRVGRLAGNQFWDISLRLKFTKKANYYWLEHSHWDVGVGWWREEVWDEAGGEWSLITAIEHHNAVLTSR